MLRQRHGKTWSGSQSHRVDIVVFCWLLLRLRMIARRKRAAVWAVVRVGSEPRDDAALGARVCPALAMTNAGRQLRVWKALVPIGAGLGTVALDVAPPARRLRVEGFAPGRDAVGPDAPNKLPPQAVPKPGAPVSVLPSLVAQGLPADSVGGLLQVEATAVRAIPRALRRAAVPGAVADMGDGWAAGPLALVVGSRAGLCRGDGHLKALGRIGLVEQQVN